MSVVVFEQNQSFVINSFKSGNFDYVDITTEIQEREFFQFLLDKEIIQHLGEIYPTPRKKEEVPAWAAVCTNISLRIHRSHSFYSFPYIVRIGGLIDALGPRIAERKINKEKKTIELRCHGFNNKNQYSRTTPWDQDFVRKFCKDTAPDLLMDWYNRGVNWCIRKLTGYDNDGMFIGDSTYLFVPNNPKYEGSALLLFDEHNHPVDPDKVDASLIKKGKYIWRRCYQMVSIIHTNRNKKFFAIVALRIIGGKANPLHPLYSLVKDFVNREGKGIMKRLILDRGFISGKDISRCKKKLDIDVIIGLRKNMDLLDDTLRLIAGFKHEWKEYKIKNNNEKESNRILPPAIQKREEKRQQTLKKKKKEKEEKEGKEVILEKVLVTGIHNFNIWESCKVPMHTVVSREIYSDGHEDLWVLSTTEDFQDPIQIRRDYELRPLIEERHRQFKLFWDLTKFHSVSFSLVVNQVVSTLLTYSLFQIRNLYTFQGDLNPITFPQLKMELKSKADRVVVYYKQYFAFQIFHEFCEMLLILEETAKGKVLKKMRKIKNELFDLDYSPRPP